MTSITSRPFNGQLGSAEQNSDITLASGKKFVVQQGSGSASLVCENNGNVLWVRNGSNSAFNEVKMQDCSPQGDINMGAGKTVDGVYVSIFNAVLLGLG